MKYRAILGIIIELALLGVSSTATAAGPPLAASAAQGSIDVDGVTHIVYRGTNAHIIELFLRGGRWVWDDLTNLAHAPLARTSNAPNSYVRSDNLTSVVFASQADHIIELTAGTRWSVRDVTVDAGVGLDAADPVGYRRSDGTNAIVWSSTDSYIHELDWSGGHYHDTNVTVSAGQGPPSASQLFHPFWRTDGITSIPYNALDSSTAELFFLGGTWRSQPIHTQTSWPMGFRRSDNSTVMLGVASDSSHSSHLYQQILSGGTWGAASDMTVITGGPICDDYAAGYARSDGLNVLVYVGFPSYHIEEIAFTGGAWHVGDLTANAGAPPADGLYVSPYVRADGINSVPFTASNHVYDLFLSGGAWHWVDLTATATPA